MRQVVIDKWIDFTEPLEGGVAVLYNDIRGLTTTAYGNLVNSPGAVAGLPFVHPDGTPAAPADIIAAWHTVHNDPQCAIRGWTYAAKLTPLRLTRAGMSELALDKLAQNDAILAKRLAHWAQMPACAQMAVHSLAWACGANAFFPRLFSALDVHDYDAAVVEIHMNEWTKGPNGEDIKNHGLVPRNVANKILMRNASRVEAYRLDPDLLEWKYVLGVADLDTVPHLLQLNTPIMTEVAEPTSRTTSADQPTIHPMPDTLEAYRKMRDD